ncbi:MAG: PolC-type DNA polymerase III, partial [Lachnospiraceae bacterium]|nr:PolC-type DNA polymerase III [Lachnospiraceae bacterium]
MKAFFEVFPKLRLDQALHDLMEETQVEKITATKKKDFLRIYLFSRNLIEKRKIWKVEEEIRRQLFAQAPVTVKIYERFELSAQYTPERLLDLYRDSILEELKEYSHVEYLAFKSAKFEYPDEHRMIVSLEDSVLVRSKEEEFLRILEKILVERCGFSVAIQVEYREKEKESSRQEEERVIRMKVAEITGRLKGYGPMEGIAVPGPAQQEAKDRNASGAEQGNAAAQGGAEKTGSVKEGAPALREASAGKFQKKEFQKTEFKKGEFKRSERSFDRGAVKKSDNPDVIYGRDFEEEPQKIEDVIGEIGEVVLQGKILKLDTREIKNEKTIIMFDITDFTDTMSVKLCARNDQVKEITGGLKPGAFIKVKGIAMMDKFDHELTIGSIAGIKKGSDFTVGRSDHALYKRVELHCH